MPSMEQEDLLSTLRQLEPEEEPGLEAQVLQRMEYLLNALEDLKLKQSITNELLIELVEQGKGKARSDFGSQVSPIRNKPTPRPIRRSFGNR